MLSGSASTVLLGTVCSILHMLAARCAFISDLSLSLSCSAVLYGAHGFLHDNLLAGLDVFFIESSPYPAAHLHSAVAPGPFADIPELYALLLVPVDVRLEGLVPRVVFVSLVHHEAVDVQHLSHASSTQMTAPGRCWIDIELRGQILLSAI